jgi:hypothetical protein
MRTWLAPLCLLTVLAVAAGPPASAATAEKTFDQTYDLPAGKELQLSNVNGGIELQAWDRNEIRVVATIKARAATSGSAEDLLEKVQIEIEDHGDRLEIDTIRPNRSGSGFLSWIFGGGSSGTEVSYRLSAPRDLVASLKTVNGRIESRGVGGSLHLSSTNGAIRVEGAHGSVQARTTNGAIYAELHQVEADAELLFDTTNGGITVNLPESIQTTVRARTSNGSVSTDFPLETKGWRRNSASGTLNGGGSGQLRLTSTNGAIRIRSL